MMSLWVHVVLATSAFGGATVQPLQPAGPAPTASGGGPVASGAAPGTVSNVAYQCHSDGTMPPNILVTAVLTNSGGSPRAYSPMLRVLTPGKCVAWAGCVPVKREDNPCPDAPCTERKPDAIKTFTAARVVVPARSSATVTFSVPNMTINGSTVLAETPSGTSNAPGAAFAMCE